MDAPTPELLSRLQTVLKARRPVSFQRPNGGYTPAERWIVRLDDGSSCFVKTGGRIWADRLRIEHDTYVGLQDASFLPRLLAWDDDGTQPILVLEDLSAATWPPPWTPQKIEQVLSALESVRRAEVPGVRRMIEIDTDFGRHWQLVAADPDPFLRLGLCSASWLSDSLVLLDATATSVELGGTDLLHNDLRSDNLCFIDDRVVIIDWDCACLGSGVLDIAAWLPSLHSEGGPLPEDILPGEPGLASAIAGYLAYYAGQFALNPRPSNVPNLRLAEARSALPWAVRALGLPPLDRENSPA